jgi:hypothetical protein
MYERRESCKTSRPRHIPLRKYLGNPFFPAPQKSTFVFLCVETEALLAVESISQYFCSFTYLLFFLCNSKFSNYLASPVKKWINSFSLF